MGQHGIDDGAHGFSVVIGDGLALQAAMRVERSIPVAIMVRVAIGRVGDHGMHGRQRGHDVAAIAVP